MTDNRIFVFYPKSTPPNLVGLLKTSASEAEKKAAEVKSYTCSQYLANVKRALIDRARALQLNIRVMVVEEIAGAADGMIADKFGRQQSTENVFVMPYPSFKAIQDPYSLGKTKITPNQKLMIAGVGSIIAAVILYYVYTKYFRK